MFLYGCSWAIFLFFYYEILLFFHSCSILAIILFAQNIEKGWTLFIACKAMPMTSVSYVIIYANYAPHHSSWSMITFISMRSLWVLVECWFSMGQPTHTCIKLLHNNGWQAGVCDLTCRYVVVQYRSVFPTSMVPSSPHTYQMPRSAGTWLQANRIARSCLTRQTLFIAKILSRTR